MNRRSFFRSLSAAVVGCYLGVGVELKKDEWVLNPAWVDAEYDVEFLVAPGYYDFLQKHVDPLFFKRVNNRTELL